MRRDEARLILLNLSVLAGLALLHVLFSSTLGRPPRVFYLAIFGRLLMQVLELLWLHTAGGRLSERLLPAYCHLSIGLHLGFAFLLSRLGGFEDSHYVALMVIPVLAAGFRYRWPGITLVVAAAVGLTFLEVRLYYADNPARMNVTEYFEASNVMLIYVVVAVVAALLSRRLRAERAAVEHNLEALERTRDQLVREEKLAAVGRLSAAIAHEIRNPVSLILSSLDLAREGGPGALPDDEVRDIVHQEARRLETLTGDFLLYARQRPPQRRPTALGETLEYVASLLRSRLEERRLDLVLEPPPDLEVEADPFQLHQALLNLLANAVDAAEAGGTLRLGASLASPPGAAVSSVAGPTAGWDHPGPVALFVETAGAAIPPQVVERIFEPFYTTKPSGTGLGLAIAREIARRHGGDLRLAVNRPGAVRFEITLPGPLRRRAPDAVEEELADGPHPDR